MAGRRNKTGDCSECEARACAALACGMVTACGAAAEVDAPALAPLPAERGETGLERKRSLSVVRVDAFSGMAIPSLRFSLVRPQ